MMELDDLKNRNSEYAHGKGDGAAKNKNGT